MNIGKEKDIKRFQSIQLDSLKPEKDIEGAVTNSKQRNSDRKLVYGATSIISDQDETFRTTKCFKTEESS